MIEQELEICLHRAFVKARDKRHQVVSLEHLLFELLETSAVRELVAARGVDVDRVRSRLARYIDTHTPRIAKNREVDTQPNLEFQRAIQDAILRRQGSVEGKVGGADVLMAISRQKRAAAVRLLDGEDLPDGPHTDDGEESEEEIVVPATAEEIERAKALQIVMLNDDRTPMAFVVTILQKFFSMNREEASDAMLEVHQQGKAVLGLYARDAAKAQLADVLSHIREHNHPLRCILVVPK